MEIFVRRRECGRICQLLCVYMVFMFFVRFKSQNSDQSRGSPIGVAALTRQGQANTYGFACPFLLRRILFTKCSQAKRKYLCTST